MKSILVMVGILFSTQSFASETLKCTAGALINAKTVESVEFLVDLDRRNFENNTKGNLIEDEETGWLSTLKVFSSKISTITYSLATQLGGYSVLIHDSETGHSARSVAVSLSGNVNLMKTYPNNTGETWSTKFFTLSCSLR